MRLLSPLVSSAAISENKRIDTQKGSRSALSQYRLPAQGSKYREEDTGSVPRLRDPATWLLQADEASSRNLEPVFLNITVVYRTLHSKRYLPSHHPGIGCQFVVSEGEEESMHANEASISMLQQICAKNLALGCVILSPRSQGFGRPDSRNLGGPLFRPTL